MSTTDTKRNIGDQVIADMCEITRAAGIGHAAGYNAAENDRARRQRHFLHSCPDCGAPVHQEPGHCVRCAWDGAGR